MENFHTLNTAQLLMLLVLIFVLGAIGFVWAVVRELRTFEVWQKNNATKGGMQ